MLLMKIKILEANKYTVNKTFYSYKICNDIIEQYKKKYNEGIKHVGELNKSKDFSSVVLVNASHKIINLFLENDILYADIEILDTKFGKELKKIYLHNRKNVMFYICGNCNIDSDGIVDNYEFISIHADTKN